MKWKLSPSILLLCLFACQENVAPEPKEDVSIKEEKKPSIDGDAWKSLEGQWREVKQNNDGWKAELPCEGEGSSLIFSSRKEEYSLAQFTEDMLIQDKNLSLLEHNDGVFVIQGEGLRLEAKLQDGILSTTDGFFSQLQGNTAVERIYIDKNTCVGEPSFAGIEELEGEWYDAPCGAMVLKLEGKEFRYRDEASELLWIQPENERYWITLKKAKKTYGVLVVPAATNLQLWSGRYDSWKPVNLYPRSKDCPK